MKKIILSLAVLTAMTTTAMADGLMIRGNAMLECGTRTDCIIKTFDKAGEYSHSSIAFLKLEGLSDEEIADMQKFQYSLNDTVTLSYTLENQTQNKGK